MAPPIVEVVLQVAVSDAELELLQEVGVLHQVQRVEDVKVFLTEKGKRMWQREFSQLKDTFLNYVGTISAESILQRLSLFTVS